MMTHALESTTLTDFQSVSGHFTHCWEFRSALRAANSIVLAVPIYSISDLYANSLNRFTLRKWSCEVLSLHNAYLPEHTCTLPAKYREIANSKLLLQSSCVYLCKWMMSMLLMVNSTVQPLYKWTLSSNLE